jgi:cell pole-organizing protein PopZ
MSVVNPSSGDRDNEALRRAQRTHERSMEEILASIRNMIVDERADERAAPFKAASPRVGATGPQVVYSKDDHAQRATSDVVLPAGPPRPAEPKPMPEVAAAPPEIKAAARRKTAPDAKPVSGTNDLSSNSPTGGSDASYSLPDDEPLLSREAGQTVSSAFEALSANLAAQGVEIARDLACEMLRPMLKAWLDENLPGIVERLVRTEIERVARGFR